MAKLTRKDVKRVISIAREQGKWPDFNKANMSGANLSGMDLSKATLIEANLNGANLSLASLFRANLSRANLSQANLKATNLSKANLKDTNLSKANLSGVNLKWANLNRTDLSEAILSRAKLNKANLNQTKGLETVQHYGPSSISTDTLIRAQGQIPVEFLRGCGLSDLDIEYAKLHNPNLTPAQVSDIGHEIITMLTGPTIRYNACFISYNHQDQPFAQHLYDNLQNSGVRCWLASEDIRSSDKLQPIINEAIHLHQKLLLILSESALNSGWVESEVKTAFEQERRQNQTVLFPIQLDEAIMNTEQAWAIEMRQRHIGDFTRWTDEVVYNECFQHLLEDLAIGHPPIVVDKS